MGTLSSTLCIGCTLKKIGDRALKKKRPAFRVLLSRAELRVFYRSALESITKPNRFLFGEREGCFSFSSGEEKGSPKPPPKRNRLSILRGLALCVYTYRKDLEPNNDFFSGSARGAFLSLKKSTPRIMQWLPYDFFGGERERNLSFPKGGQCPLTIAAADPFGSINNLPYDFFGGERENPLSFSIGGLCSLTFAAAVSFESINNLP